MMKQRIVSIGPHQAAKIFGILYFVLGLLISAFILIGALLGSAEGGMLVFAVAAPFIYGGLGYVFVFLAALLYNAIAARVGGLQITLAPEE